MTTARSDADRLLNLLDAIASDELAISADELREEVQEQHAVYETASEKLQKSIHKLVSEAGRERLHLAKSAYDQARVILERARPRVASGSRSRSRDELLGDLSRLFGSHKEMTLAFRSLEELSDSDLERILEDHGRLAELDGMLNPRDGSKS